MQFETTISQMGNMKKLIIIVFISIIISSCQQKSESENNNKIVAVENLTSRTSANVDTALKFINSYVENCNKKNSMEIVKWVTSNSYTTEKFRNELTQLIKNANTIDPELGLGFDPIFNAQDYPEEGFKLESLDTKSGYLVVTGKNWKDFKLKMKLIEDNNKWLVDGCGIINIPKIKQIKQH